MKKTTLVFALLILSISLFGCGNEIPSQQSAFKANFSLNSIVEANKEYLLEETRISSGAEVGPQEPFVQSHEEMVVQIDPADVPTFMQDIRLYIGGSLADNNANVLGQEVNGNNDVGFFSYSYSENDLYGTITVWGVRGEGTNYFLIVMITES
jgi:hypothetical protein